MSRKCEVGKGSKWEELLIGEGSGETKWQKSWKCKCVATRYKIYSCKCQIISQNFQKYADVTIGIKMSEVLMILK